MSDVKLKVTDLQWVYPALRRREKDVVALKDINLEVRESEFVVIVGPSGCGKSTLINLIGGLEHVEEGKIQVDGEEVTDPGAERGMVFQGYSLFPWLTVQKNVEFGLKMQRVPKKE
ncbi:MAG: ATP-binding cassette domain-containing protein, partial [Lachnospiraceae bacterium]|nr:ATP-binding cassette domain-containing protein [Lachnospiraceae bacterium]